VAAENALLLGVAIPCPFSVLVPRSRPQGVRAPPLLPMAFSANFPARVGRGARSNPLAYWGAVAALKRRVARPHRAAALWSSRALATFAGH
jgi:hypothetical protein